jgi:hypothetical protein
VQFGAFFGAQLVVDDHDFHLGAIGQVGRQVWRAPGTVPRG